jgi:hypothetical protein
MNERNVQYKQLDQYRDTSLDEKRKVVAGSKPVEDSGSLLVVHFRDGISSRSAAHFAIEATSMISGTSREKPADDRFLFIDHIWSAYEVTGEVMRKRGAMWVITHATNDMILVDDYQQSPIYSIRP